MSREFGHYVLEEMIGSGGMGEVWRARDVRFDRLVAVKLLPESLNRDAEFSGRFRRESHVAARLREPHVVPIHEYGEIDGRLYIDMRLVDGRDLGELLEDGPIPPDRTVMLLSQVADALEAAHADGLVHRDVKPSNVLVTASDFVYVVDFGIVRSIGSTRTSLTITGATVGTLDYMAPERFTDQPIDGRVDVYSLACVLAQCLTARRPFSGEDLPALLYAHLYVDPPQPSKVVAGVPPALDAVVARGMAKRPEDRYATPTDLIVAARDALREAPSRTIPTAVARAVVRSTPPVPGQDGSRGAAEPAGAAPPPSTAAPRSTPAPPTVLGVRSGDGAHSSVQQLPTAAPAPSGDVPPPGGAPLPPEGRAPRGRGAGRRKRRLALVIALALLVLVGGLAAWLWPRDDAGAGGTATTDSQAGDTPAPRTDAAPPPSSTPPADSLAVPLQVGEPIATAPTPGHLAVAPDGRFAYIAHRDAGVLSVLDTTSLQVVSQIPIDAGPPRFVAFSPDGDRAYVTVHDATFTQNAVVFVDTASNTVIDTVPVGRRPLAPEVSPDGGLLYVPLHDEGRVLVIDTGSAREVTSYPVPPNPHWIAVSADGTRAYTANHESDVLSVLDLTDGGRVVDQVQAGDSPHSVAISPDGSRVAVVAFDSSEAYVLDTATGTTRHVSVGQDPQDVTWASDGRRFYTADVDADTMSVVDAETLQVTAAPVTGDGPTSVEVSPDGRRAYVTNLFSATVVVYQLTA